MLSGCKLLKHKILIGILYGCGLRCMEVRNLRLCDLDFDRKQLKVVQEKAKRPLFATFGHLIRGLKSISKRKNQKIISLGCHEKEELALRLRSAQASIPDIRNGAFNGR